MKRISYSLLFTALLYTCPLTAQPVKILFDASKAEMAGNADWVIDADQHNIGFNTNGTAATGRGNESNPQILPTPAQANITSSTAETYWEGSLSSWAIEMVKRGYEVESLPYNGSITYGNTSNAQDLSHYKVFVVCEPNIQFSASEKTAILSFVQHGGGLFMISDHDQSDRNNDGWDSPHIWNDLMGTASPFGIQFDLVNISGSSTNINHVTGDSCLTGPGGTVTQVLWTNGTTMTIDPTVNPAVRGLIYTASGTRGGNTNIMFATSRYGKGKIAAIGDSSPCDDGTGDPNDQLYNGWSQDAGGNHAKLITNATIWLAATGSVSGVEEIDTYSPKLKVFPNPIVNRIMHVETEIVSAEPIRVFNTLGQEVYQYTLTNPSGDLDLTHLSKGIYIYTYGAFDSGKIVILD